MLPIESAKASSASGAGDLPLGPRLRAGLPVEMGDAASDWGLDEARLQMELMAELASAG